MFNTCSRLAGFWSNRALVVVATLLAGSAPLALAQAQGRTDQLYISGTPAPDGNGMLDFLVTSPVLNQSGQVGISAAVAGTNGGTSDNQGIYRLSDSGIVQLARKGQVAPNGNGVFASLFSRTLNDLGQVAFSATLSGTTGGTTDNAGIFRSDGTSMIQIARRGQAVPGGDGAFQSFGTPVLNLSGQAAFSSTLSGTSAGSDTGIYRGAGGAITQIAREGQAAPDGNGTLESFGPVSLNNAGQTAFRATLAGTSGGTADYSGIFSGNGGNLTQIVRGGQAVPGGNGVFADFNFSNHSTFSNAGQAAFYATLSGTSGGSGDDRGIYRGSGGAVTQIAREGQAAPDANGVFSDFNAPVVNDAGQLAFEGFLTGTANGGSDNSGVYRGSGGALTQVAREGQAAPDGNGVFSNFDKLNIGSAGELVFTSSLTGTSGGSSDSSGIFAGDGTDLLQVARRGDSLAGSTVSSLVLADSAAVNQHGQVAYLAALANGKEVVNRWTPELHWRAAFSSTWDTSGRWTLGLNPAGVHDVFIDPAASVTVTGPSTDRTVRSLRVGGGPGLATLELRNGARLTAVNGVTIQSTGTLTGDGSIAGAVANHGNIVASNLVFTGTVTNHWSIQGGGRIHAQLVNASGGEIRANGGEALWLSGATLSNQSGGRIRALGGGQIRVSGLSNTNAGLIEIHGGSELVSTPRLTNSAGTGLISLRDGSLIGNGGITNAGSIALTLGNSTIQGDIANTGTIQVSGGAHATFLDDVVQNGTLQVSTVGNTVSTAVLLGAFTGGGGFVGGGDVFALGDLRPGNSPASVLYNGNLFLGSSTDTYIELGGLGVGLFDQLVVTGDLNLSGDLYVSLLGGHSLEVNQLYLIGDIGGSLAGQFNGLVEGALVGNFGGHDLFITYAAGDGNGIGLFTAVPEPATGLLLTMGLSGIAMIRRRRNSSARGRMQRTGEIGRISCIRPTISALAALLAFPCTALLAQPTITNLGVLPNGSLSIANGISTDGSTVTGYSNNGQFTNIRAFRWTAGDGMQDLGVLPGYSSSDGQAVSGNGSVIVGGGSGFQHAWRWTSGGLQDLGTLASGPNSAALGVSGDGSLVTGWSQAGGTTQRPFRWTSAGGMVDLGVLAGGTAGAGAAVSGNGQFIAGYSNFAGSGSGTHATRWTSSGIEDLGAIAGSSRATAISQDGSVVVGWTSTNNGDRAFRWTEAGGLVNLGVPSPPGTFPVSAAYAVSGDGLTVGGEWAGGGGFLWRADLGPVDLGAWLLAEGVDTGGWTFSRVTGLSHDGSVLAGTGFFNNQQRGWIVDLNSAIPEPSTGWMLMLAGAVSPVRRRERSRQRS